MMTACRAARQAYNQVASMPSCPYSIRYWPTWLGLGLLWCLSRLPWAWQLGIGRRLGRLLRNFGRRREHIAAVNLTLCFPDMPAGERDRVITGLFDSIGIGSMEMAMSWWAPDRKLRPLADIQGLEHLQTALQQGKGAILLSGHFTTLEIGGRLLAQRVPFHVMYREHKNTAFEAVMHAARVRNFDKAIPRGDLRGMLNSLKDNIPVWYAPDQDYGADQSIFVPFFGIPAASITATSRLARISGAPVVPFFQARLPGTRGYRLTLYPALDNFPGASVEADTQRINTLLEDRIREQPEQYLWVHRRFKTRPPGEPGVYDRYNKNMP
jgi:KDO2-lipid IV(A) lauroyltransferase